MDIEKRIEILTERLRYVQDIFGNKENEHTALLATNLKEFLRKEPKLSIQDKVKHLSTLEDLFNFSENNLDRALTPMDMVRIVRHPQRICLKDILENVYDNYTELGGQDEYSIDPSMVIARAYITRRRGKHVQHQPVMVVGQEKGHGQEFRNGGSVKPWGNANALNYMKVAETENIPIHTYIFTPGSYPIEDYPGAAQQIARNLYAMAGLNVPIISVCSEGGSGGAEAIGLSDYRLMLQYGYYSVISPEGAAAIEGRVRQGMKTPEGLVERCAKLLKITAKDNLSMGYIDRIVSEPPLGARPEHYDFYKTLRQEIIRATDEVVLNVKGIQLFRAMALRRLRKVSVSPHLDLERMHNRWDLSQAARERLVYRRYQKYARMSRQARTDSSTPTKKIYSFAHDLGWSLFSYFRYDLFRKHQKRVVDTAQELGAEVHLVWDRILDPCRETFSKICKPKDLGKEKEQQLTQLSDWDQCGDHNGGWCYVSPRALDDRAVTCPNSETHGCPDMWSRDLFGDFAGVCSHCGHHFPMEYQWYLNNVFDQNSIREFSTSVESKNPLNFEGFAEKLEQAKKKTNLKSSCMTFEARIDNVKMIVAMLIGSFRGGTVGAAEGEKFLRAAGPGQKKNTFLSCVMCTAPPASVSRKVPTALSRCPAAPWPYAATWKQAVCIWYSTTPIPMPVRWPVSWAVRPTSSPYARPTSVSPAPVSSKKPQVWTFRRITTVRTAPFPVDTSTASGTARDVRKNLYQALMTMGGRNLYYR